MSLFGKKKQEREYGDFGGNRQMVTVVAQVTDLDRDMMGNVTVNVPADDAWNQSIVEQAIHAQHDMKHIKLRKWSKK